ncbi:MAG: hypothetical protein SFY66_11350 [Oculatellaceae cyanobacterium bins.114]|nr:hypothetical protein [Oculatellaceae cyanobacterium bins.114]
MRLSQPPNFTNDLGLLYIDGEVLTVVGGVPNHNQVVLNLTGTLNLSFKRQPYRVFATDQRLWIPQNRSDR